MQAPVAQKVMQSPRLEKLENASSQPSTRYHSSHSPWLLSPSTAQRMVPSTAQRMVGASSSWSNYNESPVEDSNLILSKQILIEKLEKLAQCSPETARRAVGVYGDEPTYVWQLDEKMQIMLDWVAAHDISEATNDPICSSKSMIADKLRQLANCAPETARRAVDAFGDDPRHTWQLDEKFQVMLDWITAYHISGTEETGDQKRLWTTANEDGRWEQLGNQDDDEAYSDLSSLEEDEENEFEQVQSFPVKKQKAVGSLPRGSMRGYGVPGYPTIPRMLDAAIVGPPFFYFENVSGMPTGEWNSISRHLFNIKPEFTDSRYFSACRRQRGYIHNLPVEGRREIIPRAPATIKELIPACQEYWPDWDPRMCLNCIVTQRPTESVHRKVEQMLELWLDKSKPPPAFVRGQVVRLAAENNLVWIKPGGLGSLTMNEIEQVMGYDKDHTRILYHPNDQMKCLGNSFHVHTVGYHFSVLKPLYPQGLKVLALFAGIGGAEVALQKAGVHLKVVVSVESDEKARRVLAHWWKTSKQTGELILDHTDVRALDRKNLGMLLAKVGGFDLIVGGSPCTNLSGMNRHTRFGLAGESSILFFEFSRIVSQVRDFMTRRWSM